MGSKSPYTIIHKESNSIDGSVRFGEQYITLKRCLYAVFKETNPEVFFTGALEFGGGLQSRSKGICQKSMMMVLEIFIIELLVCLVQRINV